MQYLQYSCTFHVAKLRRIIQLPKYYVIILILFVSIGSRGVVLVLYVFIMLQKYKILPTSCGHEVFHSDTKKAHTITGMSPQKTTDNKNIIKQGGNEPQPNRTLFRNPSVDIEVYREIETWHLLFGMIHEGYIIVKVDAARNPFVIKLHPYMLRHKELVHIPPHPV